MPASRFSCGVPAVPLKAPYNESSERSATSPMSLSKRGLLEGVAAAGVIAARPAVWSFDDPSQAICRRWLALDRERESLLKAWSQVEAALMRDPGWRALSVKAKAAHAGSRRLAEIDRQLEQLYDEGEAVLALLPSTPATKIETIIAHLSVAERLLPAEENEQVHGMIGRAVRDLKALTARS
jgi:hypothetical protein